MLPNSVFEQLFKVIQGTEVVGWLVGWVVMSGNVVEQETISMRGFPFR